MRKIVGIFFFFFFIFIFLFGKPYFIAAQDSKSDLEKKIQEYQAKLNELRQQKSTLSSEIEYMDTQIYLTTLRIQETEDKIEKTQQEMDLLTTKIQGLDTSLDYFLKMLVKRVVEGYKQKSVSFFDLILNSDNAGDLVGEIKYQKTAQENNQKLLIQVQRAKINYEEQKTLREEKVKELDNLKTVLDAQKIELNNQQDAKRNLLVITNNDETTYQRLLQEAQRQLSAFKSFTRAAGGGTIAANGFGNGSEGWYFSQRDERWAYNRIGNSDEDILDVGCLLTSVAMVLKKYGVDTDPSKIAANSQYFYLNTAYMNYRWDLNPWPNNLTSYSLSISQIDDEIRNGHPVIVGVYAGYYGQHFIVLKSIDGDDYMMYDPYYGPDKKFSEHYSKDQIFAAETFR
ncbi:hypothetical protein COT62_01550 [Candidatus Roizmanbacteria bacterium CG09_land_8_20_14_0_10_41_9]|uniref:Peptidase C39-like domain-containing protein n=1 Tax=Candidatus Roizmanbacteria bacterium CG09_land_8_20_14_0_10_41_9 TaxID=1974850 RepID=A0A2H0WVA3_9BACT|nr:MAG: hypothetical protein COT62_01550 [Candidatus Roizmanbacteria bacterium CG09_land_8_20_14_0_10_41_9]